MIRRLAALVVLPVVLGIGGLSAVSASAAGDTNAAGFVAKANAERQSRGLRAYVVRTDLAAVALRHSQEMAAKQSLYHNPNLGSDVSNWQVVGENVGDGGSVDSIHTAFMNSPAHRANILATDYTEIGVGTVTDKNGVLWVTQVFRLPYRAPSVAAPTTTRASRSVTRPATPRKVAAKPAAVRPVAKPAAPRAVVAPAPVRPDATAFAAALVPDTAADPLAQALGYAAAMGALAG